MNFKQKLTTLAGIFLILFSCTTKVPTDLTQTAFIPKPVKVEASGDAFRINNKTTISVQKSALSTGNYLAEELKSLGGLQLKVEITDITPKHGIYFTTTSDSQLGSEGYHMEITRQRITISATGQKGWFYGVQTLLQTLPVKARAEQNLLVPTGIIEDYPEYNFRGAMLDVARHFFEVDEVKQFIDYLATYKMNVLHLHLSDDQGWRIEIKSWPKLTETGGSTEVGGGKGGFYSQQQYTDLVNYARQRQITIIPEIDMPGHTNAALASYPELNCNGKATQLYTGTEVGFSTLCTANEITYKFIDDVVRELAEITPGPYIHIGGDESHATKKEDYIPFVNRVQEIVVSHGKKVIGWDEIANATPVEGATIQFWADAKNTQLGVSKGAKVIMSPAANAYLDMQYDSTSVFGLHWAGYIEVDIGYNWNPATLVSEVSRENILGIEAPLWSETVSNLDEAEYLVFPRLPGYAEIGWSAPETRNWNDYKTRLAAHGDRFEAMGINFYRSAQIQWK